MRRTLILAAALAAPVVLPAQAANASPVCSDVIVSGVVSVNPPPACAPYPFETTCTTGSTGLPGLLLVNDSTCMPAVLGAEAP